MLNNSQNQRESGVDRPIAIPPTRNRCRLAVRQVAVVTLYVSAPCVDTAYARQKNNAVFIAINRNVCYGVTVLVTV